MYESDYISELSPDYRGTNSIGRAARRYHFSTERSKRLEKHVSCFLPNIRLINL